MSSSASVAVVAGAAYESHVAAAAAAGPFAPGGVSHFPPASAAALSTNQTLFLVWLLHLHLTEMAVERVWMTLLWVVDFEAVVAVTVVKLPREISALQQLEVATTATALGQKLTVSSGIVGGLIVGAAESASFEVEKASAAAVFAQVAVVSVALTGEFAPLVLRSNARTEMAEMAVAAVVVANSTIAEIEALAAASATVAGEAVAIEGSWAGALVLFAKRREELTELKRECSSHQHGQLFVFARSQVGSTKNLKILKKRRDSPQPVGQRATYVVRAGSIENSHLSYQQFQRTAGNHLGPSNVRRCSKEA